MERNEKKTLVSAKMHNFPSSLWTNETIMIYLNIQLVKSIPVDNSRRVDLKSRNPVSTFTAAELIVVLVEFELNILRQQQ